MTKFADIIRGTTKPHAATSGGWRKWRNDAKVAHPFRYWLVEECWPAIRSVVTKPFDIANSGLHYISNRFVTKTHALTSATIKKGQYAEFHTRVLHCLFDELVNFVEVECAWMEIICSSEARAKYNVPWYTISWFAFWNYRCPGAGIDYLTWAASLVYREDMGIDPTHELFGKPTDQAIAAKETLALYYWWKNTRPNRADPYNASGFSALRSKQTNIFDLDFELHDDRDNNYRSAYNKSIEIEQAYNKEDEEMLVRLTVLSKSLCT